MSINVPAIQSVGVAVATYKRADGLRRLLYSLVDQTWSGETHIVVVDNDSSASAQATTDLFDEGVVRYVVEPEPGIAAARNRAIAEMPRVDAIAFIDDDEEASRHWLASLVEGMERLGCDIVTGPVIGRPTARPPLWVRRFSPHNSPRYRTGSIVKWPATNNLLVRTETLIRFGSEPFDNAFGLTGGSDAELAWRMRQQGIAARWVDEAPVHEDIPPGRMAFQWWWNRSVKQGNVSARLMMRSKPRKHVATVGLLRILYGATLGAIHSLVSPQAKGMAPFANLPKGIGTLRALNGNFFVEYARPQK